MASTTTSRLTLGMFFLVWVLVSVETTTEAFVLPTRSFLSQQRQQSWPSPVSETHRVCLYARKKRRKRKETPVPKEEEDVEDEEDAAETPVVSAAPVAPRGDQAVALNVQDIRTLVGGSSSADSTTPVSTPPSSATTTPTTTVPSATVGSSQPTTAGTSTFGGSDDALQQLLADAKTMEGSGSSRSASKEGGNGSGDEGSFSIPSSVRNLISTIVAVDFFVVCIFLLWFLAGVFASSVLDNDAIQLAFNGIFEPLVQPALGILMIGALAGAVFKDENEEGGDKGGFNL